jgi:glycosyltransferase involved in cell wall biosynthesis
MRVLLLSQFYAPVVGGTERVVEDLACALERRGHRVSVATLAASPRDTADEDGPYVYRLRSSAQRVPGLHREADRPHALPIPDPEVTLALRRIVARERPDVVHGHDWLIHSYLPLRRLGGPPVLLSLHDYSLVCPTRRLFRRDEPCTGPGAFKCFGCAGAQHGPLRGTSLVGLTRIGNRSLRRAVDMFLPVSDAVAQASGLSAPGSPLPFRVIPNFVAAGLAERAQIDRAIELPREFLLFVGDATADKGIDVLLEAHAMLQKPPPLVVLGRPYSAGLASARSDVRVVGAQSHDVALDAIRKSTVTIIPSLVPETFGMVALEAMALGRPIIASAIGGLAQLLRDGETAVLVRPGDVEALRRALQDLLARPEARERIAAAGRADAERFAEVAVLPQLEAVYRITVADRNHSGAVEGRRAVSS